MSAPSLEAIISITKNSVEKLAPEISELIESYLTKEERNLTYFDYFKLADILEETALRLNDEQKSSLVRVAELWREKGRNNVSNELFDLEGDIDILLKNGQVEPAISLVKKVFALGDQIKDQTSSQYISKKFARYFLDKSEYIKAAEWFRKALDINPRDYESLIGLSFALSSGGNTEEALQVTEQAIILYPNGVDFWYNKGYLLMHLNKQQEALDAIEKVIEIDPTYMPVWRIKGFILNLMGKFKESISSYEEHNKRTKHKDADALNEEGNIYHNSLKDYENAEKCYRKALESNKNHKFASMNLGKVYTKKEEWKKAIKYYDKVIEIDSSFPDAWFGKALVYELQGNFEKAQDCYKRATEIDSEKEEANFVLGFSLYKIGKYEEAIKKFHREIELRGRVRENASMWYHKALCFEGLGKNEEALECYEEAVDLEPTDLGTLKGLVRLLASFERYSEAVKYLDRITQIDSKNPDMWNLKGTIYQDFLKNYQEAIKCYNQAIKADSQYKFAWYKLGITYSILEMNEKAIEAFNKAIELDSQYLDACYEKAKVEESQKRYKEALESYKKCAELDPKNTKALFRIGYILGELKNYRDAIDAYSKVLEIDNRDIAAWGNKGYNYRMLKEYQNSIDCYDHALEIDPKYMYALNGTALTLQLQENWKEAMKYLDQALEIEPDNVQALLEKGLSLQNLKSEKEALECYDQVISLKPEDSVLAIAWANKSLILMRQQKHEAALEAVAKALELDPNYVLALNIKAALLFDYFNKVEEAYECFQHASEIEPENKDILCNLPEVLTVLEKHNEAINKVKEILELDLTPSRKIVMQYLLFANLLFSDKEKDAKAELTELLKLYRTTLRGKKVDWDFHGFRRFLEANTSRHKHLLLKLIDLFEQKIGINEFQN
ncbi:MAG: tetratricopeptide repeat protein [Candidatus Bathyarchaeum sp.]|nr:MAG: tetratricopeptide repeat protein [Candidatus Bathyarchaeum sp.]